MFVAFPMVKLSPEQAATTIAVYVAQLRDFPLWAIETGCQSCIAKATPFPPSAGELREACLRAVTPLAEEAAQLRSVLEAEVYTTPPEPGYAIFKREQSDRSKAMVDEIHRTNDMLRQGKTPPPYIPGVTKVPPHQTPRPKYNVEEEQKKLNELLEKRKNEPLPQLSDEALRIFNEKKPPDDIDDREFM
jgi:hypothetical protein